MRTDTELEAASVAGMSRLVYLTVAEVAARAGVKASRVLYWINAKKLPAVNVAGSDDGYHPQWRIADADLEPFLLALPTMPRATSRPKRPTEPSMIEFV